MDSFQTIIPTLRYSPGIDRAIDSALQYGPSSGTVLVSVNGVSTDSYRLSPFWNHNRVDWVCRNSEKAPLHQSLNFAIHNSSADWIFLLSDDDALLPGFLDGFDLSRQNVHTLYSTRLRNITEDGKLLGQSRAPSLPELEGAAIRKAFLNNEFRDNLSLFVMSREMFLSTGGYGDTGYPNGYFVDTVLHAKALSRALRVVVAPDPVVLRTTSMTQGSAQFYIGPEAVGFLQTTRDSLWSDEIFRSWISTWIPDEELLLEKLVSERFVTEWAKLGNKQYGSNRHRRISLFVSMMLFWNVSRTTKAKGIKLLLGSATQRTRRLLRKRVRGLKSLFRNLG